MNQTRAIKQDFVVIYFLVLLFFGVTLLIHPEYGYYYKRADYGVWDHVLHLYRGIYAYLYIRLLERPAQIKKCVKISGWIMYPYSVYKIINALRRGYWLGYAMNMEGQVEMSYSVAFGYEILPFVMFFLWDALYEKRISDIVPSVIGIFMIMIAGSRGPFLFILELIAIFVLLQIKESRKRIIIIILVVLTGLLTYFYGDLILKWLIRVLAKFGFSSRILNTLVLGTVSSDSGRNMIWNTTIEMIKENPFGYGAMGTRHRLTTMVYTGYPHSILLEFLVDYGVVLGSALFGIFMLFSFKLIFRSDNEWRFVFIPMFCAACCLFISLTYWSIPAYWSCLAIGYSSVLAKKRKAIIQQCSGVDLKLVEQRLE
jgi:hypothetical protein